MKKNKNIDDLLALTMLGMCGWGSLGRSRYLESLQPYRVEKQSRKCLLPRCKIETIHNGGYCCGDHCREHNQILKEQKEHPVAQLNEFQSATNPQPKTQ